MSKEYIAPTNDVLYIIDDYLLKAIHMLNNTPKNYKALNEFTIKARQWLLYDDEDSKAWKVAAFAEEKFKIAHPEMKNNTISENEYYSRNWTEYVNYIKEGLKNYGLSDPEIYKE